MSSSLREAWTGREGGRGEGCRAVGRHQVGEAVLGGELLPDDRADAVPDRRVAARLSAAPSFAFIGRFPCCPGRP